MLVTTYRQAYKTPLTKLKAEKLAASGNACPCPLDITAEKKDEIPCPPVEIPSVELNRMNIACADLQPPPVANLCADDTTVRFLGNMRSLHPDLYERIKNMPSDELNRLLQLDVNRTNYMIDYCKFQQYPDGLFDNEVAKAKVNICEKEKEVQSKVNAKDLQCTGPYRPYKYKFEKDTLKQKDNIKNSNLVTEYMGEFSKTGCTIMKNHIHNHSRCNPKYCNHPLKYCTIKY